MSRKPIVRMQESFKIFVDKFNILSNNVGDPLQLNTYQDSDLVTVINEIEAAFDASAGEILYPNGQAGETQTRLKISTNQSGGDDIDIDAGQDFLVDAVRNIELTSVNFDLDLSGNSNIAIDSDRTSTVGGTSSDTVVGAVTIVGNSTYSLTTGDDFTQTTTGTIQFNASDHFKIDAAADITLDADGNDIIFKNGGGGDQVTHNLNDNANYTMTTPGSYFIDAVKDITLDADGNDIIFKNGAGGDQVTHSLADGAGYTVTAPGSYTLDVVGDIILDADGNDLVFRNGAGGDSAQINLADTGNLTVNTPNNLILDVANDIILDAGGDNITLKDGGNTRQEYTLGATTTIATTGNRTETVTGNVSDSAVGSYHIGATGNMDIDTRGTLDVVTGGDATLDTTGTVDVNATQNIVLDAGGDITLDADDNDIIFKNGTGGDTVTHNINNNGTYTVTAPSHVLIDAVGDITLDAGDSDLIFSRDGTEFVKTQMGMSGDATLVRQLYSQGGLELDVAGNFTVDASGDIILDAAADDVILKDAGTEFLRFTHAGNGNAGIDNNGIRVITFEDSDAVFENDVNIEGDLDVDLTLNVDGNTTLNANVTLGNATTDEISATGQFVTSLVPLTDDAYSIGNATKEWKHGYFDGTVFADNLDGDSGTIANFNINTNTISNSTAGLIVDVAGDIVLDAGGDDIKFRMDDSDRIEWDLGYGQTSVTNKVHNRNLVFDVDKNIYLDANEGRVYLRDSASNNRFQVHFTGATGTEVDVANGSLTMDVDGDIVLDADGGDVLLRDGGTQFGRFQNTSGNLILRSGDTTAMTFDGANVTTAGTITPGTTLNTTATELVGAINEIDSDLGTRTSLSSFYDSHNQDIVTALNRVADRIIDVYDASGTLLNN